MRAAWAIVVVSVLGLAFAVVGPDLFPAPGGSSLALAAGDHVVAFEHQGRRRSYLVHVPPAVSSGAALPVVLDFHGAWRSGWGQRAWSRFDRLSDAEGFLAVEPQGTGPLPGVGRTWNASGCCGYARAHEVDDVGFVVTLLEDLARRVPVDHTRVYATGLSNGGMMAHRLAADAPERFAAVASVAGPFMETGFASDRPTPVMHIHSRSDERVPFGGGAGSSFPPLGNDPYPPVAATIGTWVEHDGCPRTPSEDPAREDASHHRAVRSTYGPCRDGTEVVLWTLTGPGHVWPGAPSTWRSLLLGPATSVIDASEEMWRFFRRFSRPDAPPLAG